MSRRHPQRSGGLTAFLIVLALIAGCAARPAQHFMAAGVALDAISTRQALREGCVEANPLFPGLQPEQALLAGAAQMGVVYLLTDRAPDWLLWSLGSFRLGIAAHNYSTDC